MYKVMFVTCSIQKLHSAWIFMVKVKNKTNKKNRAESAWNCSSSTFNSMITMKNILHIFVSLWALFYTQCKVAPSTTQVSFLRDQSCWHFPIQGTCTHLSTHGCVGLKMKCSQVLCWCIATLRQRKAIAQSMSSHLKWLRKKNQWRSISLLFSGCVINIVIPTCITCMYTLLVTHRDVAHCTNIQKIKNEKIKLWKIITLLLVESCSRAFISRMSRSISSTERHAFLLPAKSAIIIAVCQGAVVPDF